MIYLVYDYWYDIPQLCAVCKSELKAHLIKQDVIRIRNHRPVKVLSVKSDEYLNQILAFV